MAGPVPAIHVFVGVFFEDVNAPAPQTSLRSLRKLDCGAGHDESPSALLLTHSADGAK
jgi:hypothetical protein